MTCVEMECGEHMTYNPYMNLDVATCQNPEAQYEISSGDFKFMLYGLIETFFTRCVTQIEKKNIHWFVLQVLEKDASATLVSLWIWTGVCSWWNADV